MATILNPDDCSPNLGLSNGYLTATLNTRASSGVRATTSKSSGKWYFEITITAFQNYIYIGIADLAYTLDNNCGFTSGSGGYSGYSGYYNSSQAALGIGSFGQNDIIGVALDLDSGKLWWSKNGSWSLGGIGDPANGTGAPFSSNIIGKTFFPCVSMFTAGSAVTCNFGATAFEYSIPTGFSAWDAEVDDSTALTGMALDIQAFYSSIDDAGLDIAARYQAMESCPIDIQTLGEASRNNILDISVGLLSITNMPLSAMLAKETNMNVVMDILLSSGIITRNMAMDINVGDGNKRQDLGVDIMAVTSRPEFRYVYAMNLSSVIKEIAE